METSFTALAQDRPLQEVSSLSSSSSPAPESNTSDKNNDNNNNNNNNENNNGNNLVFSTLTSFFPWKKNARKLPIRRPKPHSSLLTTWSLNKSTKSSPSKPNEHDGTRKTTNMPENMAQRQTVFFIDNTPKTGSKPTGVEFRNIYGLQPGEGQGQAEPQDYGLRTAGRRTSELAQPAQALSESASSVEYRGQKRLAMGLSPSVDVTPGKRTRRRTTRASTAASELRSALSSKPAARRTRLRDFEKRPVDEILQRVDSVRLKISDPQTNELVDLNEYQHQHVAKQSLQDLLARVRPDPSLLGVCTQETDTSANTVDTTTTQQPVSLVQKAGAIPSDCSIGTLTELHQTDTVYLRDNESAAASANTSVVMRTDEEGIVVSDQDMGATPSNVEILTLRSSSADIPLLNPNVITLREPVSAPVQATRRNPRRALSISELTDNYESTVVRNRANEQTTRPSPTPNIAIPPVTENAENSDHQTSSEQVSQKTRGTEQQPLNSTQNPPQNPSQNPSQNQSIPAASPRSHSPTHPDNSHITIESGSDDPEESEAESESEYGLEESGLEICAVVPRFKGRPLVSIDDNVMVIPESEDEAIEIDSQSDDDEDSDLEHGFETAHNSLESSRNGSISTANSSNPVDTDVAGAIDVSTSTINADDKPSEDKTAKNAIEATDDAGKNITDASVVASVDASVDTAANNADTGIGSAVETTTTKEDPYSSKNMSELRHLLKLKGLKPGRSRAELLDTLKSVVKFNSKVASKTDIFKQINDELTSSLQPSAKSIWTRMLVYEPVKADELHRFFHSEFELLVDKEFVQEWADWAGVTLTHRT